MNRHVAIWITLDQLPNKYTLSRTNIVDHKSQQGISSRSSLHLEIDKITDGPHKRVTVKYKSKVHRSEVQT